MNRSVRLASSITPDEFNMSGSPSLIGYWDCATNRGGSQIIDRSGYDHHLDVGFASGASLTGLPTDMSSGNTLVDTWSDDNGIKLEKYDYFEITATGTPLDTLAKTIVYTIDFHSIAGSSDFDIGTAWDIYGHHVVDKTTYNGFSVGVVGQTPYFRIAESDLITEQAPPNFPSSATAVAAAWIPSSRMIGITNTQSLDTITTGASINMTTKTTLGNAQSGKFRVQSIGASSSAIIKSIQLWAFDTEPANLEETITWMVNNPSKLPKWWEGR